MCHWNASFSPLSMPRNAGRGSLSLFQRDILPTQRNSACRVSDLPASALQIALRFSKGAAGQGQDIVSDLPASALQIALRYSKGAAGQGQDICDFGEGGICAVRHVFFSRNFLQLSWSFCTSWETVVTMQDVCAFLCRRRYGKMGSCNQLLRASSELMTCPTSCSQSTDASFLLSAVSSLQGMWRSAACTAHDLVIAEADGKMTRLIIENYHFWKLSPQLNWTHHFVANRWGSSGNSGWLYFWGLPNHCRRWLQPWN